MFFTFSVKYLAVLALSFKNSQEPSVLKKITIYLRNMAVLFHTHFFSKIISKKTPLFDRKVYTSQKYSIF